MSTNPPKRIYELMVWLNDHPERVDEVKDEVSLRMLLQYALIPANKFLLPEGEPDGGFGSDDAPYSMTAVNLNPELRRLYIFTRKDLKPMVRENYFIELMKSITRDEGRMMVAIKDQNIETLFPNIPYAKLASHWWNHTWVSGAKSKDYTPESKPVAEGTPPKRSPGRPKGSKNKPKGVA